MPSPGSARLPRRDQRPSTDIAKGNEGPAPSPRRRHPSSSSSRAPLRCNPRSSEWSNPSRRDAKASPSHGFLGQRCPHSCLGFPPPSPSQTFSQKRFPSDLETNARLAWPGRGMEQGSRLQAAGSSPAATAWGGHTKALRESRSSRACGWGPQSSTHTSSCLPPRHSCLGGRESPAAPAQALPWGGSSPPPAWGKTALQTLPASAFGPWEPACTPHLDFVDAGRTNHRSSIRKVWRKEENVKNKKKKSQAEPESAQRHRGEAAHGTWPPPQEPYAPTGRYK